MRPARQFALPFPHEAQYAPDDFCPGAANEAALTWLENPAAWPAGRLAVHGEPGTGKTHLLHLFAARHGATLLAGLCLRGLPPLPASPAIAVDDADLARDEEALLHLLNAAAETGRPLLLAGRAPPARWPFRLPDLVSRLRATASVALLPPEDSLLRALLARLLADRQLRVPEPVQAYLLARLPRTGGALREAVARLDRASLAAGGTVTRALAQAVADSLEADEAGATVKGATVQEKGPGALPPGLF